MNGLILFTVMFISVDVTELKQKAVESFDKAEKKVLTVVVDDVDKVEECPCNGKGFIVHGDGHKTKCPGTNDGPCKFASQEPVISEVEPKTSTKAVEKTKTDKVVEHGLIYMYSRKDCFYCKKFLASNDLKQMLKSGWRVIEIKPSPGAVPLFKVIMSGKTYPVEGILTVSKLNKINIQYKKDFNIKG